MMSVMKCEEKESLQHECAAKWDAYVETARELGLLVDPGPVRPPLISELVSSRSALGPAGAAYSTALRLRGEHLKASRDLSRHLSKHRC